MTRLLAAVYLVLLTVGATPAPVALEAVAGPAATALTQSEPATLTVYITKTGDKYHRDVCRNLSRSKIPVSLKEAVEHGYGPCSVCKPPTIRTR